MRNKLYKSVSLALYFLLLLPAFFVSDVVAQSIAVSAIIRPRFEIQKGYRVPPDSLSTPQVLVSQRTRLNVAYGSDRFNAFISIQDARVWGDEAFASDVPALGIHEAWGQYNFSQKAGLKVGRQEFAYDNKRLLTNGEWPQQSRAYDAAVLKLNLARGWKMDAAGSFNQGTQNSLLNPPGFGSFYSLSNYKTLDFIWVNKTKTDSFYKYSISGLVMGDGYQQGITGFKDSSLKMRYTYGINGSYDHQRWGINFEAYGQSGKTRFVNQSGIFIPDSFQTVKAFFFSVNPWVAAGNFILGVATDYMSGSNVFDSSDVTHMFNPQYGANDRFYGKIDLFFNMPADTRNAGLIDNYLTLRYLYKKWNFGFEGHYYLLANEVEDIENPGQPLDKKLGSELDFSAIKDITKDVNINTGVAVFFPTRSMEFVKSAAFSQLGGPTITGFYFYLQLTFKPVFFSK